MLANALRCPEMVKESPIMPTFEELAGRQYERFVAEETS